MTKQERYDDTAAVKEALQRLPTGVKATLAANIAAVEMAYRAGYDDGLTAGREKEAAA